MKIAVISTPIFSLPLQNYGGLEHLAWQTAKGLAEKGHQVVLFAPDNSTCPGVEVFPFGPAGTLDEKTAYSRYWQVLPQFQVIIDETWMKYSYILKMEGKLSSPILGVMHAPINTMYQNLPPVEKPCMVCISNDQLAHFEAFHGRPARVARNGIDVKFYRSTGVKRSNRFLFLARFSSIKGPDIAIEACRQAGATLDLIGDTSITNEPDFFDLCKSVCDGEKIKMIGPATRGETVHWYSQAFCMLHPNARFREPLGLAPLESMACGNPCAAWRYGAMKETILEGVTGWLVSSFDELVSVIKVIQSDGVSDKMRRDCVDWAAQFSVQKMVDRYEELCMEAMETGGW